MLKEMLLIGGRKKFFREVAVEDAKPFPHDPTVAIEGPAVAYLKIGRGSQNEDDWREVSRQRMRGKPAIRADIKFGEDAVGYYRREADDAGKMFEENHNTVRDGYPNYGQIAENYYNAAVVEARHTRRLRQYLEPDYPASPTSSQKEPGDTQVPVRSAGPRGARIPKNKMHVLGEVGKTIAYGSESVPVQGAKGKVKKPGKHWMIF